MKSFRAKRQFALLLGVLAVGPLFGAKKTAEMEPAVFTSDIEAGIRAHVDAEVKKGGGYFVVTRPEGDLKLKLVRVHTEYLARLGPRHHFACVDLAEVGGDVYDVDFFLIGDPGAMQVTNTMLHKLNGQPYYLWKQNEKDKTWGRVPATTDDKKLMGVLTGTDRFEFTYKATLPSLATNATLWIPIARSDAFQDVKVLSVKCPGKYERFEEPAFSNGVLRARLTPQDSGRILEVRYAVARREKGPYAAVEKDFARFLGPERLIPLNSNFAQTAAAVTRGKAPGLEQARALYDHVIDHMKYMKFGSGWGRGDAVYACSARSGNCTDFHSYFIALAREAGIPARFAIGASIPSERAAGGIDGYHCWAEFFAEGKWWPVDISEADKFSGLASYYFGHHPANRIELSQGRELLAEGGPSFGTVTFLAYPVIDHGGKELKAKVEFSFVRK